ncbi:putative flippase GtrA [Arcanobacterium pluranimalium]|nr:putative flippase GtrA [Arcanobacterium pluranimalium]
MPRIPANITSFSVSLIVNYILSRMFVFEAAKDVKIAKEFTAYVGLNAIALGLNTLILELCVTWIHLSAPAGKIIATGIVLIYNFFSRKMLIEKLSKRNNN